MNQTQTKGPGGIESGPGRWARVSFHLRRRTSAEPASAILLETDRVGPLLEFVASASSDQTPTIYRVANGFLIRRASLAQSPAGAVRLRALATNLFVPVDADLVPSLLDDEANGLTRDRGLVFLPDGRILGFDHRNPLSLRDLIAAGRRADQGWRAFPDRPARAERITEIVLAEPDEGDEGIDLFDGEGQEIGADGPPRPEEAGGAATLGARAAFGVARGLIGLGALLGIKALVDLGARWIDRAVERVPRLTEAILGRQEGALRELLRQFREGEIDRALRHALPLGSSGGRGGQAATDPKLPDHDPAYSLRSLLGSNRKGGGIWFGGFDVQVELASEYRKAAAEAERRGDFRRAAYIHGRLLNDFTTAAHLLGRGGLHRDAAVVYLERLDDPAAAARAFEAAGDFDRALRLYRQTANYAEAGDLLRRLGEEEAAEAEYFHAADRLASGPSHGLLAAGDLLRDRARLPARALDYYRRGWDVRPSANAVTCALRMAALFADAGESGPLLGLVDQADDLFGQWESEAETGEFYNELAKLAERPALAEIRLDLRDRALMGLAARLRQSAATRSRPGPLASTLLGRPGAWPADVVNDAAHAIRAATDETAARGRPAPEPARIIEVFSAPVAAACHAPDGGFVFLAFNTGEIFEVDIARGNVATIAEDLFLVSSMMVADPEGRNLVVLVGDEEARRLLLFTRSEISGQSDERQERTIYGRGGCWFFTPFALSEFKAAAIWNGEALTGIELRDQLHLDLPFQVELPFLKTPPSGALLLSFSVGSQVPGWSFLVHDDQDIRHVNAQGKQVRALYLDWRPSLPEGHPFGSVAPSWLAVDGDHWELAGLDAGGSVHWTALKVTDSELRRTANHAYTGNEPFLAATLVRAGLVAAVGPGRVTWLRCGPSSRVPIGQSVTQIPQPLACFACPPTDELVVVGHDGKLACVPYPR